MRSIIVLVFYFFFILILGLTGLLFDLHYGFIFGSLIAIFILVTMAIYGEKFILLLAKARYISIDEPILNQVKNLCAHLEVPEIKIYWSNTFYNNVYFVNSYFGTPSIVIGKEVYKQLSKNEMNSLIYATLLRIKSNESKHRTMINMLMLILFSWIFILESKVKNKNYKKFVTIFLFPAFYLKSIFYQKRNDTEYFDLEIFKMESLKRDYVSALFKVNSFLECHTISMGNFALSGLTHTFNKIEDSLFYLLTVHEDPIEERVKMIAGHLK